MRKGPVFAALAALVLAPGARAEDLKTFSLTLKDHKFVPTELHVLAGQPFFLVVVNKDDSADEFEMHSPPLEKTIQPGAEGRLRVRPLSAGRFEFYDDFHPQARGAFVAE